MVQTTLTPPAQTATIVNAQWIAKTTHHVVAVMENSRSTWQMWHVRAEVQRQLRAADVPGERASVLVDLLVDEVLDRRSVALVAPHDGIEEPQALRRANGSSVYRVAGADLYTSQRILDAEARLLTAAGRHGGASVDPTAVDLALLEMAANGTALDAGQASLVRQSVPPGHGCSWRSPRPAPVKQPPCVPSPWPGPKTAARCSASPRPRPRPLTLPSKPALAPTH
jgi:hypothetical protein